MEKQTNKQQKVLILGGGFGGIKTALKLADSVYDVTLLSDQDSFRYYPTLYSTALGASSLAASLPLSEIFKGKKIKIARGVAKSLNRDQKVVKDSLGNSYEYDYLVVALGVVTNFFGINGLEKYAYGVKSLEEAKRLRDHLHKQLVDEQKPDLNYVVIGGGPTGVELAGALPVYLKRIIKNHNIKHKNFHVDLVEAAPRLVPRMPQPYSRAIEKRLRRLGVKLYLNNAVKAETADALMMNGHSLESHTVVWTAGVTNHPFLKMNNFGLTDHGKAVVDEYLQSQPNIYILGDNADTKYSGMAQTALYDGEYVAENLLRLSRGKKQKSYRPNEPVYVIPAGPRWAAVQWGKMQIYGLAGWLLRESATLKGYHDYEPWWNASKHFIAQVENEESCTVCSNVSA